MSDDPSTLDTPIERASIDQIPLELLDTWLEQIRHRRLALVIKLEQAQALREAAQAAENKDKFERELVRAEKSKIKVEEALDKFETHLSKLRALAMEFE